MVTLRVTSENFPLTALAAGEPFADTRTTADDVVDPDTVHAKLPRLGAQLASAV
jgi:hypothetical protein